IVARDEEIGVGVHEMEIESLDDEGGEEGDEDEEKGAKGGIENRHWKVRHVRELLQRNNNGNTVREPALSPRPAGVSLSSLARFVHPYLRGTQEPTSRDLARMRGDSSISISESASQRR